MTYTLSVVAGESDARTLAERLDERDTGALAVDVSETSPGLWDVVLYLESSPSEVLLTLVSGVVDEVLGRHAPPLAVAKLPETNWVAKSLEGLAPVHAGRFVIHGRHDRHTVCANKTAIEIEAGQAFGTGHHGTTAACLADIHRVARSRPIRNALDLGTGSGVLAIAIAKVAKVPVVASDIDPLAAKIAHDNARLNGVGQLVTTITAAGLSRLAIRSHAPFDLIVANILAGPLVALAPAIRRAVAPGGAVILSGLLPEQRRRIVGAYRGQGLRLKRQTIRDSWLTLVFERPFKRGSKPVPIARPLGGKGQTWRAPHRRGRGGSCRPP